jgi:adenylate kinase family enzyme
VDPDLRAPVHARLIPAIVASRGLLRVNVTGNAGAGKSTIARALGDASGIEVVGLDRIVWQPYWTPTPTHQREALIADVVERPEWIVDGVSRQVRGHADLIVFIDLKRRVLLWRCARRNVRHLWRTRPDLPDGCPEALIIRRLLRIIMRFPRDVRPAILDDGSRAPAFVHLRSRQQLDEFLGELRAIARETESYSKATASPTVIPRLSLSMATARRNRIDRRAAVSESTRPAA